jgi:hypothetical protein
MTHEVSLKMDLRSLTSMGEGAWLEVEPGWRVHRHEGAWSVWGPVPPGFQHYSYAATRLVWLKGSGSRRNRPRWRIQRVKRVLAWTGDEPNGDWQTIGFTHSNLVKAYRIAKKVFLDGVENGAAYDSIARLSAGTEQLPWWSTG